MLEFDWKQFKSGTDIRGVAVEGVPGQKYNLTDEAVRRMTAGFPAVAFQTPGQAGKRAEAGRRP